jgi:hypothetical protein
MILLLPPQQQHHVDFPIPKSYGSVKTKSCSSFLLLVLHGGGGNKIVGSYRHILKFSSSPNLVAFSGCNKMWKSLVEHDVAFRQDLIAKMNARVKVLLLNHNDYGNYDDGKNNYEYLDTLVDIPSCDNLLEANRICKEAKKLRTMDFQK